MIPPLCETWVEHTIVIFCDPKVTSQRNSQGFDMQNSISKLEDCKRKATSVNTRSVSCLHWIPQDLSPDFLIIMLGSL